MREIVELMRDGNFHSGEELGRALGVSRSAIWKQLQRLQSDFGVEVYRLRGRGYRLAYPVTLLEARGVFTGMYLTWPFVTEDSLDSTNAEALRRIQAGVLAPFAVLAERQTEGRGRRGRRWVSPFGQNLYFSLVLPVERGARQLDGLSLVVGLAVLQSLRQIGVVGAGLKWPNDILVGGSKIAGVLLEIVGDLADVCHVVIGIGINVNMRTAVEPVGQSWTSIAKLLGRDTNRNHLLRALNEQLHEYLCRHSEEGFSALRQEWNANHAWQGKVVALTAGSQMIEGQVLGVDDVGALRLSVAGNERVFSGGELSLRLSDDS